MPLFPSASANGSPTLLAQAMSLLEGIAHNIGAIREFITTDDGNEEQYLRKFAHGITPAAGADEFSFEFSPEPGVGWKLLSFAATVGPIGGTPPGYVAFYIDSIASHNLLKVSDATSLLDDDFSDGHFIPPMSKLIVVFGDNGNGLDIAVNFTAKEYVPKPANRGFGAGQVDDVGITGMTGS